jgi:hypothetical protein
MITESCMAITAESRSARKSHITLDAKHTGKPSAGNLHAGFDEAGAGNRLTIRLVRHSQRKRGATDRLNLRGPAPVLDPTEGGRKKRRRKGRLAMSLTTPELFSEVADSVTGNGYGDCVSLLREPDAANPHVRCAGCGNGSRAELVRHRQTKGSVTDRSHLNHRATPRLHTSAFALISLFRLSRFPGLDQKS